MLGAVKREANCASGIGLSDDQGQARFLAGDRCHIRMRCADHCQEPRGPDRPIPLPWYV
jgi:hypothetical protein